MDRCSNYEFLKNLTNNITLIWKESNGIAPKEVTNKMNEAMLGWMKELTDCLQIWIDKKDLTDGDLILARANLGSLVESWLMFFYCVFYNDYLKSPKLKKGKVVEPNKMSFEDLKVFSLGILYDNNQSDMYIWIDKVQHMRNSIHSFNERDLGTKEDFLNDVDKLLEFVELINNHLPPLEDFLQAYPCGYIMNPHLKEQKDDKKF